MQATWLTLPLTVMRASPLDPNVNRNMLTMASIRNAEDLKEWAIGSDSDIGGMSSASLETYPDGSVDAGKGRFRGVLSSKVQPGMKLGGSKVDRSGYAGIRTKVSAPAGLLRIVGTI